MPEQNTSVQPEPDERLDVHVARRCGIDRLEARRWILSGAVRVGDRPIKPSLRLQPTDEVSVTPPLARPSAIVPVHRPLVVRHADSELVVVEKPAGMATHPGPGWWQESLLNVVMAHVSDWPGVGGVAQPGVVHRLDRDTTGLLVLARTDHAHRHLRQQVSDRSMRRIYLAWVEGNLSGSGVWEFPLGRDGADPERVVVDPSGKLATTRFEALSHADGRTLLRLTLETGRTHQIRVHASHVGHPVVGDRRYHPTPGPEPMRLHAAHLGFRHPQTGEDLAFTADPPWPTGLDLTGIEWK